MANFNLGSLREWENIVAGEVIEFPVPEAGFRLVDFDVISDCEIAVHAVGPDTAQLVAFAAGMFNVRFSCDVSTAVGFHGPETANIYIRTKMRSQALAESEEPSFTNIEPRPAGPSDEVRRMMQVVQMNALRREQALRAELMQMHANRAAEGQSLIDAGDTPPAPVPPAPAPAPKPSGDPE